MNTTNKCILIKILQQKYSASLYIEDIDIPVALKMSGYNYLIVDSEYNY